MTPIDAIRRLLRNLSLLLRRRHGMPTVRVQGWGPEQVARVLGRTR